MECPYCSNKLIKGYIKTNGEVITWSCDPKRKPRFTFRWQVYDNEIKLGTYHFVKGGRVCAYRCENCEKIIIDTKQQSSDE